MKKVAYKRIDADNQETEGVLELNDSKKYIMVVKSDNISEVHIQRLRTQMKSKFPELNLGILGINSSDDIELYEIDETSVDKNT